MIVSTDTAGRIMISTIQNVAFGLCSADKMTVVDPTKPEEEKQDRIAPQMDGTPLTYPVIDCRFYNKLHPQGFSNDSRTLISVGSTRDVIFYEIGKETWQRKLVIQRPKTYYSENM